MKRLLCLLLTVLAVITLSCCGASNGGGKTVATVTESENMVIITVEELDGTVTLLELMKDLREEGRLDFTADLSGMVQSIGGKANAADWSACWMLYTSDEEMANSEWGTIEHGGATYGSAILGANALSVIAGEVYIWSYQMV